LKIKKKIVGIVFFAVIFLTITIRVCFFNKGIALGEVTVHETDRPKEWQNIIARDINYDTMRLKVDGKEVRFAKNTMYIDEEMNIMIPLYLFRDIFKCAVNRYQPEYIELQKGNVLVLLQKDSEYMSVNHQDIYQKKQFEIKDNMVYVNAYVLKKVFSYDYKWDSQQNILCLVNQNELENILPLKYNYRLVDRLIGVKNQGDESTCWAFAALTALETSLLPQENYELSVDHMVYNNGYKSTPEEGGDHIRAIAYLAAWRGPVLEAEDQYGDGMTNSNAVVQKHVQEVQIIESKNLEAIKRAVFLYGGVESSLFTSMKNGNNNSIYYNEETNAYCYIGTKRPNHDVVIVGWDDNYPKENFCSELEADGAFICMNSWGTDFGDDGLFYVSYYDSNIGIHNVVYTGIEDTDNYDDIYQSDICGWVGQLGYEEDTAYFSNVYTARQNSYMEAVGFYATDKNTTYDLYVVEDFTGPESYENMIYMQSGKFANAGYYTVDLNSAVAMEAGKKYAVVIRIQTPNSVHPVAIEYAAGHATESVDLSDGEGYISYTGKAWEHVEETKNCNICLKMYTRYRS